MYVRGRRGGGGEEVKEKNSFDFGVRVMNLKVKFKVLVGVKLEAAFVG